MSLANDDNVAAKLTKSLRDLFVSSLGAKFPPGSPTEQFASGQGFKTYVDLALQSGSLDQSLWDLIVGAGSRFSRFCPFLEGLLHYITSTQDTVSASDVDLDSFIESLVNNLVSPNHHLKSVTLRILSELVKATGTEDHSVVSIALEIEDSELNLQTARVLSMQIRKLALIYPQIATHKWLGPLIPKFCFGLFSKKLAQLWDDSAEAIKSIVQHPIGETVVTELAMHWLQDAKPSVSEPITEDERPMVSPDYACFNAVKFESTFSAHFSNFGNPVEMLRSEFYSKHTAADLTPASPKACALRVLHAIPHIAEKRSRHIVPLFLNWVSAGGDSNATSETSSKPTETSYIDDDRPTWEYKDRLSLLGLFEKFTNPRALFKSSDVRDALLTLLTNGDSSVQRSALKGLFTWKSPSIMPYQENLLNLLDESRFRDELATFVRLDEDSTIEPGHKAELLPVLLRILYGRVVSRAAASSGSGGQGGRRKAILRALSQLSESDFGLFIKVAFGPLYNLSLGEGGKIDSAVFDQELLNLRRQSGLLKMIETMFDTLRSRMVPYAAKSMNVVTYCLVRATRLLQAQPDDESAVRHTNVLRDIRQESIRCLSLIFSVTPDVDWSAHVATLFDEIINPRLENFAVENAQGVSGLHRLFHTWASSANSVFYLSRYNSSLIRSVTDTLNVPSAQDDVKVFIMSQIIQPVIAFSTGITADGDEVMGDFSRDEIHNGVLAPYVEHILVHLSRLLQQNPPRSVLSSGVDTLSAISPCVKSSGEIINLLKTSTYLLRQPHDRIPLKTKAGLLRTLQHFIPLFSIESDQSLADDIFRTVVSLYTEFNDDATRNLISTVFREYAKLDDELLQVSELCADLNAVATHKLDTVDYEKRLQAFTKINEDLWSTLGSKQWRPLLFNMLFHVKDEQELAIRASACFGLKRFIERSVMAETDKEGFDELRDQVLLPALRQGTRQRSELIRMEVVSVLGHLVKTNPTLPSVQDMHVLLVGGDEEASFFNNILHIQQHRRLRALRRLAAEVGKGVINTSNIESIFIPLVEHFIFQIAEDDESAHNLAAEAVATIGTLSEWLEWPQFRSIFRRYRALMTSKPEIEKNMIRLLGRMTDVLAKSAGQNVPQTGDEMDTDADGSPEAARQKSRLAATLPAASKVASELNNQFIPFLTDFVHQKDETVMSLRLPVAVTTVKLLKLLSEEDMAIRLPGVLLDVCYVLRSKAQVSRDIARKTLAEMAVILGPSYFGYIIKELRTALVRGYQLHVLSFTVHTILVETTDIYKQGDLDHCLEDLVAVVMDDIFGVAGQEKDAEEYISQMKEVKSSKSYDSMELLAKNSSVTRLGALIAPIQLLLREKLTASTVRKIDELLRRIGVGLLRNPGAESRDILIFCYEVMKESHEQQPTTEPTSAESARNKRFLVNMHGARRDGKRGSTSSYIHKLTRFALDVLRSILNKFHSLSTPANLAGLLPAIGDAVIQAHEEVKMSAMRLLSTIIKVPLPELDKNAPVYLIEAVNVVRDAPSTNTEPAQAALKLIAAIMRERKSVPIRDSHLAYLLKKLTTDIEEPDRQGVTFNFIRAVMDRKLLVPEMYELVDNIARMMVTNQTRAARDLARGVYIHFLIEYPQAKSRWNKQLAFLAKNLDYEYREGRESVLEAIHMLLSKIGGNLSQEVISTFFLPVLLVMANDETSECRQMAGVLLGEFFARAEREQLQTMLKPIKSWLEQTDNMQLVNTGLQAMRVYFDVGQNELEKEARFVISALPELVEPILQDHESEHWETVYFAWQLFAKMGKAVPAISFSKACSQIWTDIQESLFYPHAWIKTCAANLVGAWFSDIAKTNASAGLRSLPLAGKHGLELDGERMFRLTRASIRCLLAPNVPEELGMQSVRNLVFLVRCFAENSLGSSTTKSDTDESESDSESEPEANENGDMESTAANNDAATRSNPIRYIVRQISIILRRETINTKSSVALVPKTASIALLAAVCRYLSAEQLRPLLPTILLPLQHLIDPAIPTPRSSDESFQNAYKSIVGNAREILDLLQNKLGTTEYVAQMAQVQERIRARREERRIKRRIEAVTDPEKHGEEKRRKNERKKIKRREKGMEYRDRRRGW